MISCNGEPYTLKGVSTVLRGDYANLLQKCDKAAFSYSTRRASLTKTFPCYRVARASRALSFPIRKRNCTKSTRIILRKRDIKSRYSIYASHTALNGGIR